MDIISCMCRPFVIYLCYPQEIYFHEKFRPLSQCMDINSDENGTDIFRPYLRPNSFREVQICPYPSPDIQHPIPYPYPNTQIAYL